MQTFLGKNNRSKEEKNEIEFVNKPSSNISQLKTFSISNSPLMKPVELLSDSIHHFSLSRNKKKRRNSLKSNTESISEVMSNKSKTQSNSHLSEYDTIQSSNSKGAHSSYSKNNPVSPYLTPSMKNLRLDSPASPTSNSTVSHLNNMDNINVPVAPVNSNYNSFNNAYNAMNNANNSMELDINEQTISYNYRQSLSKYLENCKQNYFEKIDFTSSDGIYKWEEGGKNRSIEYILSLFLNYRFSLEWENEKRKIQQAKENKQSLINDGTSIKVNFKIMEAKDLVCKEKTTRNTFCELAYDNETYQTLIVPNSNSPLFNQHISLEITDISKNVIINLYDSKKSSKSFWRSTSNPNSSDATFLGTVNINLGSVISTLINVGYISKWYDLGQSQDKKKKWVGGKIKIEIEMIEEEKNEEADNVLSESQGFAYEYEQVQLQFFKCKLSYKRLYYYLLKVCYVYEKDYLEKVKQKNLSKKYQTEKEQDEDTNVLSSVHLSEDGETVLNVFQKLWVIGDAENTLLRLEVIYNLYRGNIVTISNLLTMYDIIYNKLKEPQWLPAYEQPHFIDLLDDMHSYQKIQVCHYHDFFHNNEPKGALQIAILLWRMVSKNKIFRQSKNNLPKTFREEICSELKYSAYKRYDLLKSKSTPFQESAECELTSVINLINLIINDLEDSEKYYKKAFSRETNITKLTGQVYIEKFLNEFSNIKKYLQAEEALQYSDVAFSLFNEILHLESYYKKNIPSIKNIFINKTADSNGNESIIEAYFYPFIQRWLEDLDKKTSEWVKKAIAEDDYQNNTIYNIPHSSSIVKLFDMIYNELNFIKNLKWNNYIQYQGFLLTFSKTINKAIDQYCELIKEGEIKSTSKESKSDNQVYIVSNESCTKLCNIEVAQLKLADIYGEINELITENYITDEESLEEVSSSVFSGIYLMQILCGENLTPCNNDGFSNPYTVIRIPANLNTMENGEGNIMENDIEKANDENMTIDDLMKSKGHLDEEKNIEQLSSADFNRGRLVAKSSVVHDYLNPIWNETFQVSICPTNSLDVKVYNKNSNFLMENQICGTGTIKFSSIYNNHQTHDVWVDLEPQGRVLIRLTKVGNSENLEFHLKQATHHLKRCRDDFVRAIVNRMTPYMRIVLYKMIKDQEASKTVGSSLSKNLLNVARQYSIGPISGNQNNNNNNSDNNNDNNNTSNNPSEQKNQNPNTRNDQYADLYKPFYSEEELKEMVTNTGHNVLEPISMLECETSLAPLTRYLNRNLQTLCLGLSPKMAKIVITKIWCEVLIIIENTMIPQLYGPIEKDRKILNPRQLAAINNAFMILYSFFHADGQGMGLSKDLLEHGSKYNSIKHLFTIYGMSPISIQKEYEMFPEKEYLLRIIRLRAHLSTNPVIKNKLTQWVKQSIRLQGIGNCISIYP
ncbi:hypothetical protein BCR36DRAFT_579330 [Piromyces finnis]|uniref:C2 domain-containing protein n=1 Tax=Piromyces finnis TaxID=1754191 RepID=A0A1Y1VLS4_9FUNG|nr:hypothetical protein BCR36DRAFT_579330 [Piromyces finnis]|eukprot:ORX59883.1 hypothetical protein BCR36DRAFT_579330 [Piromyces finnis]